MDPLSITILVIATLGCGYMAWNIGANDVANAMGTSVGSQALTLKGAVIVAALFEFSGAVLAGSRVTDTIRRGMIDTSIFAGDPMLLVYGMLAALLASAIWLNIASHFGLPVSTTHSIVGAVTGFGIIAGGVTAIAWGTMLKIVASWLISPLTGGLMAFFLFRLINRRIINADNPMEALRRFAPGMVFVVITIICLVLFTGGMARINQGIEWWHGFALAALVGSVMAGFSLRLIRHVEAIPSAAVGDRRTAPAERVFKYLQIMTACYVAFAHGSNDVANAVGPYAAVVSILQSRSVSDQTIVPLWILMLGGVGIVIGLATLGYKVIETIGRRITELTPSRGFAAEFGTASTVIICSKLGIPISTTHTLVGAVMGVGFARGLSALDFRVVRNILSTWIITIPVTMVIAMMLFALLRLLFG